MSLARKDNMNYKEDLQERLALIEVGTGGRTYPLERILRGDTLDTITDMVLEEIHRKQVDALWELLEYMSQFPDINLADVREWIKDFEGER